MRILIVEDERVAARGLERTVREILGNRVESLRIQETLTAAECFLEEHPIDLLLLDLNLRGDDGFSLLEAAAAGSFQTIVVSANTDRAIDAFSHGVLDFVPKPVDRGRLTRALGRIEESGSGQAKVLSVRREERIRLIPLSSIRFFQAQDNYVELHLDDGSTERHRKTLESLARILPEGYVRIHRSYLVERSRIAEVRATTSGHIAVLTTGEDLPVGRSRLAEILPPEEV